MMRLRCVSDLHFEFQRDRGATLLTEIVQDDAFDVLVVAGDLTSSESLASSLERLAKATPKDIIYVLGNHEYYGASFSGVTETVNEVRGKFPNLHILEQETVEIQGKRFVGCTLWYPHPKELDSDEDMGDFTFILTWPGEIHAKSQASANFLKKTVREGDIVVTHFLPHPKSIAPVYKNSTLNHYFLHNVRNVVEKSGAVLWAHGHTHSSMDYQAGSARVVCNPFGYAKVGHPTEPNRKFNPRFTVEV